MTSSPEPLTFTETELDMLGRTADALSAWLGKPVLAEVIDAEETGFEWVVFGIPLDTEDDPEKSIVVSIGGQGARLLGNRGGLPLKDDEVYSCEYLWAIQLSDLEGIRFIKVDHEGEEVAWSLDIGGILPFSIEEPEPAPEDDDTDDDDDDEPFSVHPANPQTRH